MSFSFFNSFIVVSVAFWKGAELNVCVVSGLDKHDIWYVIQHTFKRP